MMHNVAELDNLPSVSCLSFQFNVCELASSTGNKYSSCVCFPCGSAGKEPTCSAETWVLSLGWEDPLEKEKVTHSNILAWRIPWTV